MAHIGLNGGQAEPARFATSVRAIGRRGSRRCWAAAFAAPFGRKPYGATSCHARRPRHRPQPVPAVTPRCRATRAGPGRHARAECADHRAKDHSHRDGTPRIVQVGPSSVKGTPRSFLTASQKGSSGPTPERWSLCRPSGPDGEGQARGQARTARGEPPHSVGSPSRGSGDDPLRPLTAYIHGPDRQTALLAHMYDGQR